VIVQAHGQVAAMTHHSGRLADQTLLQLDRFAMPTDGLAYSIIAADQRRQVVVAQRQVIVIRKSGFVFSGNLLEKVNRFAAGRFRGRRLTVSQHIAQVVQCDRQIAGVLWL
jgi:hypothetical protein